MNREIRNAAADLGCGLFAFLVIRVVPLITGQHQDIRPFLLTTFLAFLGGTLYRFRQTDMHRGRVLSCVFLGGVAPAVLLRLLGMSLTANPFLLVFLATSLGATACGALVKSIWWTTGWIAAVVTCCLCTLAVTVVAYRTVPDWLDRRAFQTVDEALPPFSVQTLGGPILTSEELRGRVVVVAFWATWCLPCQAELPKLQAVSKRYRNNPKVSILAVDSGTEGDTTSKVQSYLLRRRLDLPVLIDSIDGSAPGLAAKSFGVPSLPALYIVDTTGRLRSIHLGYEASEDLETSLSRQIDRLL